jgi:flagellin
MLAIKNNIMAENAARQLSKAYDALGKSVERLSSGLRINGAKDDAAGLAVRELMRADIAVIKQGGRNAQDAISMLQTMEGAMAAIDDALIRMKELAEQASTGSYSEMQRNIMNTEFQQMMQEIDRIADTTGFNSINMLNSATASNTIHFGVASTIVVNSVDVRTSALIDSATTISISGADGVSAQSALFGYLMNRLESTNEVLNIQAENLMAAESRISDVDVATEMAALTRNQVLAQAGVAMLGQANTMPQMALNLLRT